MVKHTPPFHNKRKADGEKEEKKRTKNKTRHTRGTQWCSGTTCVLAELRAHYPEHHNKEKERKRIEANTHHTHRHSAQHKPSH
nr:MAG TPA: hypothetical protein [Caudoviricetes sp.]